MYSVYVPKDGHSKADFIGYYKDYVEARNKAKEYIEKLVEDNNMSYIEECIIHEHTRIERN